MQFDEPPRRLAAAFALGVFIAFSPWLGLHIVSAVALAWLFRLNKVVVLTASLLNNPWTIVPMYVFCLWSASGSRAGRCSAEIAWTSSVQRALHRSQALPPALHRRDDRCGNDRGLPFLLPLRLGGQAVPPI